MVSVNRVTLAGNAGRDAEVRYLPSGQKVATVSLATSSRRKDKNSGEMIEDTQWHRVTFYERLAEIAGEFVKKGRTIYVEGRLKYGKYTDKDGIERNTTDIIATELQLLGSGHRDDASTSDEGSRPRTAGTQRPSASPPRHSAGDRAGRPAGGGPALEDPNDEDVPFADPLRRRAFCLAL